MAPENVARTPTASLLDRPVSAYTSASKKIALDANEAEVTLLSRLKPMSFGCLMKAAERAVIDANRRSFIIDREHSEYARSVRSAYEQLEKGYLERNELETWLKDRFLEMEALIASIADPDIIHNTQLII